MGEVGVCALNIISCLVYRGGMEFGVIVGVIIIITICLVYRVVIELLQLMLVPLATILYPVSPLIPPLL